jgi:hypothetical protein
MLLVAARRSKYLPLGGRVDDRALGAISDELHRALEAARNAGELQFDEAVSALWCEIYILLSADRVGQYGEATARAEAQVLRLALIYALLDSAPVIRLEHLFAAVALWDYCDRSAAFLFGDSRSDRIEDAVIRELRAFDVWMTREALVNALGRHSAGAKLQRAIDPLLRDGLMERREEPTLGRPRELFRATKARKGSIVDLCSLSSRFAELWNRHAVEESESVSSAPVDRKSTAR